MILNSTITLLVVAACLAAMAAIPAGNAAARQNVIDSKRYQHAL